MIMLSNEHRSTLYDLLSAWSCEDGGADFEALRIRAKVVGPLEVTCEECTGILTAFGSDTLDVWRRGVALMERIELGATYETD